MKITSIIILVLFLLSCSSTDINSKLHNWNKVDFNPGHSLLNEEFDYGIRCIYDIQLSSPAKIYEINFRENSTHEARYFYSKTTNKLDTFYVYKSPKVDSNLIEIITSFKDAEINLVVNYNEKIAFEDGVDFSCTYSYNKIYSIAFKTHQVNRFPQLNKMLSLFKARSNLLFEKEKIKPILPGYLLDKNGVTVEKILF